LPVRVEFDSGFVPGFAERFRPHQNHRHCDVHAARFNAVDDIEWLAGGEHFLGDRPDRTLEIELDGRRSPGNAVYCGVARVGDLATGSLHDGIDQGLGVDVEDANRRLAGLRRHEARLDRKRPHRDQHVAAVGLGVDDPLVDLHLGKEVIHVRLGLLRLADDRHFARDRVRAADAIHLDLVRRSHHGEQHGVARGSVGGQVGGQKKRATRRSAAHHDTRDLGLHVDISNETH
jgi:hypothetical protein